MGWDPNKGVVDNLIELICQLGLEALGRYYGPYEAIVISNKDPEARGRILAQIPRALISAKNQNWIRPMMSNAGTGYGDFNPPEEGEGVWVFFDNGDPWAPLCYMGGWYTKERTIAKDLAPTKDESPTKRGFVTKAGNEIIVEDKKDSESILIKQKDGMQVKIVGKKVSVGKSGGKFEPMMRGTTVKKWLTEHVHGHSYGNTAKPVQPFPTDGLSGDTETS